MTYTIDDVREGDVVTIEQGEPGLPGFKQEVWKATGSAVGVGHLPAYQMRDLVDGGWKVVDVSHPPTPPAGSLVLVDKPDFGVGVAISKGNAVGGTHWAHGAGDWFDPQNPVEAFPVPAEPLRELLDAWEGMSDYAQDVWARGYGEGTGSLVRARLSAFIAHIRTEWERAGIEP